MQMDRALLVEVDQQAACGGAEQGVGVGDDRDHRGSAREDFAIEVGAELTQRPTAARLLAAVPGLHGRLQDASLVAHLLMQRDVAGFDAGHDVRTGNADQVSGLLGAQDRVGRCLVFVGGGLRTATHGGAVEQLGEVAPDQPRDLGRQLDVAADDLDEGVDLDADRQRRDGRVLAGLDGFAGRLHGQQSSRSTRKTRKTRYSRNGVQEQNGLEVNHAGSPF